jgi:hypothetical protein
VGIGDQDLVEDELEVVLDEFHELKVAEIGAVDDVCPGYMPAKSACKLWVSRLLNDFANGFPQVEPGRMHSAPESITHALRESCMGDGLCPIAHA